MEETAIMTKDQRKIRYTFAQCSESSYKSRPQPLPDA